MPHYRDPSDRGLLETCPRESVSVSPDTQGSGVERVFGMGRGSGASDGGRVVVRQKPFDLRAYPSTHWRQCARIIRSSGFVNTKKDENCRSVSRRTLRTDVGRRGTQAHRIDHMGKAALVGEGCAAHPAKQEAVA